MSTRWGLHLQARLRVHGQAWTVLGLLFDQAAGKTAKLRDSPDQTAKNGKSDPVSAASVKKMEQDAVEIKGEQDQRGELPSSAGKKTQPGSSGDVKELLTEATTLLKSLRPLAATSSIGWWGNSRPETG